MATLMRPHWEIPPLIPKSRISKIIIIIIKKQFQEPQRFSLKMPRNENHKESHRARKCSKEFHNGRRRPIPPPIPFQNFQPPREKFQNFTYFNQNYKMLKNGEFNQRLLALKISNHREMISNVLINHFSEFQLFPEEKRFFHQRKFNG